MITSQTGDNTAVVWPPLNVYYKDVCLCYKQDATFYNFPLKY